MSRRPDYVSKLETAAGVRYEVRVHGARPDGTRFQRKRRFKTVDAAVEWYTQTAAEMSAGTHIVADELTLRAAVDAYLDSLDVRPNTMSAYTQSLRPVIAVLGDRPAQSIRREDLERLVKRLEAGGVPLTDWRRPMRQPKGNSSVTDPWKATSIRPMLARLNAVFTRLHEDGTVKRNVAALVKPPKTEKFVQKTLTVDQVELLYRSVSEHRHEHLFHLALHGLRRGEIAGLKWSNLLLNGDSPTLRIEGARIENAGGSGAIDSATKTENSVRELPIPSTLLPVLKRARKRARAEQLAAGGRWSTAGHVVCNEFGAALYPNTVGTIWNAGLRAANIPHVRLHDARHTCGTLMHLNGVPIAVIAAWLGHGDASFTQRTYAHSEPAALTDAAAKYAAVLTPTKEA